MPMTSIPVLELNGYEPLASQRENLLIFVASLREAAAYFEAAAGHVDSISADEIKRNAREIEFFASDVGEYCDSAF